MTIADNFAVFHEANPHVYVMFSKFTFEAINNGRKNFGARTVWEHMRWFTNIVAPDLMTTYKLNDHYIAYYSRLFMKDHPRYEGFYRVRGHGYVPRFRRKEKKESNTEWLA